MMNDFQYDILIRTVGRGGEKYQNLLDSIKDLKTQPKNIFVVLPEGAEQPNEKLGKETFVYAQKGMMSQRLKALDIQTSEYILFLDDDLRFSSDFADKLFKGFEKGFDVMVGEILELLPAKSGIKHFLPIITAAAVPSLFNKDRYVTILKSSGWSYNRFLPKADLIIPTQSAAGCMFMCSRSVFFGIGLCDELWAQHDSIAPAEDQIMFYKANLRGFKVGVATDAHIIHLDAKNATPNISSLKNKAFFSGYNRMVFWHRFIYKMQKNFFAKFCSVIAFLYNRISSFLYLFFRSLIKPSEKYSLSQFSGLFAGIKYIRSDEYKKLPPI